MKEVMKEYLDEYFESWIKDRGSYPMVPYDEDEVSELCFGEVDEDEYIQWKYQENHKEIDFSALEENYAVKIPDELKEYYTSYLFLQLEGFYKDMHIWLHPITEHTDILSDLTYELENEGKEYIGIGIVSPIDVPVCVALATGKVIYYDYEKEQGYELAASLTELFQKMLPIKNRSMEGI